MLTIKLLDDPRDRRWSGFAEGEPDCTIFHLAGWLGVFRDCFQVQPFFLQALDGGGNLLGILPLYAGHSLFLGKYLSSTGGGALSRSSAVSAALYERALALRDEHRLRYLCLRGDRIAGREPHRLLPTVNTVFDLGAGEEAIWSGLGSNLRRKVRRAAKNGFTVEDAPCRLQEFYEVYARNVKALGTPVFGREMFGAMERYFGGRMKLLVVQKKGSVVGGQLCLKIRDTWTSLYVGVDRSLLSLYPTYLLYWEAIRRAIADGASWLDLGRSSPGGGTHFFKRQWAGQDVFRDFAYYYSGRPAGPFPEQMGPPARPWRKLWSKMPLGLANLMGPMIRRSLPLA